MGSIVGAMRMIATIAALLASGLALAAPTEAELVDRYLSGDAPTVSSEARVDKPGALLLNDPNLHLTRQELGSVVLKSVGGTLDLDLSGQSLALRGVDRYDALAEEARVRSEVVGSVCSLRAEVLHYRDAASRSLALEASQRRLDMLVTAMNARAALGEVSSFDAARVAMVADTRRPDPAELFGAQSIAADRIADGLGEPVPEVDFGELAPLPPLSSILARGLSGSPELMSQRAHAEAASRRLTAARLGLVPDLNVYAAMRLDELPGASDTGPSGYELGLSVEIPLWDKNRADRRDVSDERARLEYDLAVSRGMLEAELGGLYDVAAALEREAPPAIDPDAAWAEALAAWQTGAAALPELLTTAERLDDVTLDQIAYDTARRRSRLELSCAAGVFLEADIQDAVEQALD